MTGERGGPAPSRTLAAAVATDPVDPRAPVDAEAGSGRSSLVGGILRTARPKQWAKNLLVFAAPGAAGALGNTHVLLMTLGAFGIFCVAASGTYYFNDALDWEADQLHPVKRLRPVASGVLPVKLCVWIGVGLMAAGVGLAFALAGGRLSIVMAVYVSVNLAYNLWLKSEPVLDLAAVASGFVLRTIAGGVAAGVALSDWFLIVASFGSLFIVAGRRHAEHVDLGLQGASHRSTLAFYSIGFLRYVRAVTSAVAIAAYCLWAFEKASSAASGAIWFQLSIIPFGLAVLRYALLVETGDGGAPEDIFISNRTLQVLGLAWIALFAAGVYR